MNICTCDILVIAWSGTLLWYQASKILYSNIHFLVLITFTIDYCTQTISLLVQIG